MKSARPLPLRLLGLYRRIAPTERGGYRLARAARKFLPRETWRGVFRTPDDVSLDLDLGIYPDCCMAAGLYELDTYRIFRRLLVPGSWFVDVGANIGYFSLLAARWVGARGRVDAFEPDPANGARLRENLHHNKLEQRVCVHALAAGDRAAQLTLYHPGAAGTNHGMSGAYASAFGEATPFVTSSVRLDQSLSDDCRTGPDLIKIDVEGGEMAVLRGMTGLLQTDRPPDIVVEHNPRTAAVAGFRPGDFFSLVRSIQPRYRLWWIGSWLHPIRSADQLNQIPRQVNLLLSVRNFS